MRHVTPPPSPRLYSSIAISHLGAAQLPRRRTRLEVCWILILIAIGTLAEAQNAPVIVNVDALKNRHPISPMIYGMAFASAAQLSDLNVPLNRQGGNAATRYDWTRNSSNRAADWFFESIGEPSATPGEFVDTFIGDSAAGGAQAMVTVPMIGWVAKLGAGRSNLASFSVAKYGAQQSTDYWMPDAGNGVRNNGAEVTGNDPHDANQTADSAYQLAWFQHLLSRWGPAANGPLRYYLLDNEPSIWHATHRDVHPAGAAMDEIRTKMIDYATRVKSVDPTALVAGPEEWGWSGFFYSGYDQQWGAAHGWSGSLPDRAAHGNLDYLPWLLDQMRRTTSSPASACSTFSAFTSTHRGASSATTSPRPCNSGAINPPARSGIPRTRTKRGSTTRCN